MAAVFSAIFFLSVIASPSSIAAVLPEGYPLSEAPPGPNPVDPLFAKWEAERLGVASFSEWSQERLDQWMLTASEAGRLYAALHLSRVKKSGGGEALIAARKALEEGGLVEGRALSDPMTAYVLGEIIAHPLASAEIVTLALNRLQLPENRSCPARRQLFRQVGTGLGDGTTALANFDARLEEILAYPSAYFRREAVGALVRAVAPAQRDVLAPRVRVLLGNYPRVALEAPWSIPDGDAGAESGTEAFAVVQEKARRTRCEEGRVRLSRAVAKAAPDQLDVAMEAAEALGNCFRRSSNAARLKFFQEIAGVFEQGFSFPGWAAVQTRIGLLHWSANAFDPARTALNEVLQKSRENGNASSEAEALFALGNLEENVGNMVAAEEHYRGFIARSASAGKATFGEDFERAVISLTLILAADRKWDEAMAMLQEVIRRQSELPLDRRSAAALPFAMFWTGRILFSKGQVKPAEDIWRRLASEHYSTFYGALGHYMVERNLGKRLLIEPSRASRFDMDVMLQSFDPQSRAAAVRADTLLRLGLREEASCEADLIDTASAMPPRQALKALFLYAAEEWLDAVKLYSEVPRSYRATLPVGFEKILFPQAYGEQIKHYAKKAGIDPYLAMGLIRQESVFNPRATSPAGARGLMQLMPDTARLEARKLGKGYLQGAERSRAVSVLQDKARIYDVDVNLALGVHHLNRLIGRYTSPVFALASYNASPAASARWQRNIPTEDILSFIERIPFRETKAYVKFVMRNYFYYRRWYGDFSEFPMPHLDSLLQQVVVVAEKPPPSNTTVENPSH